MPVHQLNTLNRHLLDTFWTPRPLCELTVPKNIRHNDGELEDYTSCYLQFLGRAPRRIRLLVGTRRDWRYNQLLWMQNWASFGHGRSRGCLSGILGTAGAPAFLLLTFGRGHDKGFPQVADTWQLNSLRDGERLECLHWACGVLAGPLSHCCAATNWTVAGFPTEEGRGGNWRGLQTGWWG